MQFAPDGRLFVAEQRGRLRIIKNNVLLPTPFLSLNVDSIGERGLLGVAFDPNFASNNYIYVYYTVPAPAHNRVSRFIANGDVAVPGSETVLLELENLNSANHNGGAIHFGLDGKLYIAVGDNADSSNARDLSRRLGKILRINANGTIPDDNPFVTTASARPEIWAYGLRNPFTFAVDPSSGTIYVNDVGENTWEEVNLLSKGADYGWPACEGPRNSGVGTCTSPSFTYPIHSYGRAIGQAITGGTFYRGEQFPPSHRNSYYFADYAGNWIKRLNPGGQAFDLLPASMPVDLKVGPDGYLYYLSLTGTVYKIEYVPEGNLNPTAAFTAVSQTTHIPLTVEFDGSGSSDPDDDPLTYNWNFGDGSENKTGRSVSHTYVNAGNFMATLTVDDGRGGSATADKLITAGIGAPPVATILTPAAGTSYVSNDTISYSGSAADAEDGNLSPSRLSWTIVFHHDTHTHPFLGPITGVSGGTFQIPATGEVSTNVWYRIHLTVTDSSGLTHEVTRDVVPRKTSLTLTASTPGLLLTLDGRPLPAPVAIDSVIGFTRAIGAPSLQTVNGRTYQFISWSDGGLPTHNINVPADGGVYTATYRELTSSTTVYLSDLTPLSSANGWGPVEMDRSNSEAVAGDGRVLTLNGVTYAKGLGAHAASDIQYALGGGCSLFMADIGLDDEVGANGSVVFNVFADGVQIYTSGVMLGSTATQAVNLSVAGKNELRLVVTDAADGNASDHADWAGARLSCGPDTTAPAVSAVSATQITQSGATIVWTTNEPADTQVEYGTSTAYGQTTTVNPALVASHAQALVGLNAGTLYQYRVKSRDASGNVTVSGNLTFTTLAILPPGSTSYLSDLTPLSSTNGWGPMERDRSNSEAAAGDGRVMTLDGVIYAKGLGVHGASDIRYALGGICSSFSADIGLDDEVGANGSVVFEVFADGVQIYTSGVMLSSTATQSVNLSVAGKNELRLVVTDAADGNASDHADWAGARLTCGPDTTAPAISAVSATQITQTGATIVWTTNEPADTQVEYGTTTAYGQTTTLNPALIASHAQVLVGLNPGTLYNYRVRSRDAAANVTVSGNLTFTTLAVVPPGSASYLSDLTPLSSTNGWGPVEKDRSNSEAVAGDGQVLTLNGVTYTKGLGVHAASELRYALGGGCSAFMADVGLDDEVGANGSVVFEVFADGVRIYTSGVMVGTTASQTVSVSVAGKNELRLVVTDAGDGNASDHADWAGARLSCGADTTAPSISAVSATQITQSGATVNWTTNEAADTQVDYGTTTAYGQTTAVNPALVTAHAQAIGGLSAGTLYNYRVRSRDAAGNVTVSGNLTFTTLGTAPPGSTSYLSDLTPQSSTNAWGPLERDRSNGEAVAGDGQVLTLNGVSYAKGLGVHAASDIRYALAGNCSFTADIGLDDEVGANGTVIFQVLADDVQLYTSGVMSGSTATKTVSVSLTGKKELRLVVTDAADGNASDHADWAGARLSCVLDTTAPAISSVSATQITQTGATIVWSTSEPADTQVEYGTTTAYGQTTTLNPALVEAHTQALAGLSAGTLYNYRVRSRDAAGNVAVSGNFTFTTLAVAPPTFTIYLSDVTPASSTNGLGPVEKDRSNGEGAAGDGRVLTLNGVTYTKGLGVHASSDIRYAIVGRCSAFMADIGVDDEVGSNGRVIFQVFADGVQLYNSGTMSGSTATKSIDEDISGKRELRLVVTDGGNGTSYDHADWARARVTCS